MNQDCFDAEEAALARRKHRQAEAKMVNDNAKPAPTAALPNDPTPEQRAEYIMMRLEQFIREGRTLDEGMSFRKWQLMAKTEVAIAIADAQNSIQKDDPVTRRLLFVAAAALTTIGFWGVAVSVNEAAYMAAAAICGGAGLILLAVAGEWRFRKWKGNKDAKLRAKRLKRIEDLNKKVKRLERELEKEEKAFEKKLKKAKRLNDKAAGLPPSMDAL